LQSEGKIAHEFTTVMGRHRTTETVEQVGMPVVITTTTDEEVYPDDESRFQSLHCDCSSAQSRAVVLARAKGGTTVDSRDLPVWQMAMSMIRCKKDDFNNPPKFLEFVAKQLPHHNIAVRRCWDRCLTFFSAAALLRGFATKKPLNIEFEDYCVIYCILEPVLDSTVRGVRTQEDLVVRTVAELNRKLKRYITLREIAEDLHLTYSRVRKQVKSAVRHKHLKYESGTRERNVKRIRSRRHGTQGFLPNPKLVLTNNPEIGSKVNVDPFSGEWKKVER
jgi:hypothetical protein